MNSRDLLMFVLPSLPIAAVWLAGGIYALVRWRRHPGVSLLTFLACALLFANIVVYQAVHLWLLQQATAGGVPMRSLQIWFTLLSLSYTSVGVVGYVLLLVAVFGWRFAPLYRPAALEPPTAPGRAGSEAEGIRKPGGAA